MIRSRLSHLDVRSTRSAEGVSGGVLTIDLAALADNYRLLSKIASAATCAAVVKADAYGLGVARVAPALLRAGCRRFFVAHVDEGMALREILGADAEIAVLHGALPGTESACLEAGLVPVLNSDGQRRAWQQFAKRQARTLPAMLQIDTGMARLGYSLADLKQVASDPRAFDGIDLRLVMSHLACADEPENPANSAQLLAFTTARSYLPRIAASLAASSGIFLGRDYHFDMVRPGAALFGIAPRSGGARGAVPHVGATNPMRAVVGLSAPILQARSVPKGTPIGYGHRATTSGDSRLVTVSIGYADGLLRSSSCRGEAWLGEQRLPILGRVSMDSIVLDATHVDPEALRPGTLVEIIGPHGGVDAVAARAGTNGYEILTGLGHRFHRTYLDD